MEIENTQIDSITTGESRPTNVEETPASRYCPNINIKLLPYKCFYFLFYSAAGALLPYLAIFYKQLWLSAQETGILIGIQPLLHFGSNSFWGVIADRSGRSKLIFFVALMAWLCTNYSFSLVKHPIDISLCSDNGTRIPMMAGNVHHAKKDPTETNGDVLHDGKHNTSSNGSHLNRTRRERFHRDITKNKKSQIKIALHEENENTVKQKRFTENIFNETIIEFQNEQKKRTFEELSAIGHSPWPLYAIRNVKAEDETTTSHHQDHNTFSILLIITTVGNLVSSPAVPFADTVTLQALGDNHAFFGKQRLWGALGWGVASFTVGSAVSTMQEKSKCKSPGNINYFPCFYVFAVLTIASFIPAMFFNFEDGPASETNVFGTIRTLLNTDYISCFVTVLFFGMSWGLLQTFLLWHLQDLGGTQFLFSIIAAVQCLSEVVSYHLSGFVSRMIGHHRAFYIGLLFSSLRFVVYGLIKNPWYVLPIEIFHGVSTTLVWSLAVSFVGVQPGLTTTMQGILSGVHWGLGVGGGSIVSGILVNKIGSSNTFIAFGIISLVNFLVLVTMRNLRCFRDTPEESRPLLGRPGNDHESIPLEQRLTSTE